MMEQITVNGRQIDWVSETRTAFAEASTLGLRVGQWPVTINVISHKTGNIRTWKHVGFDRNGGKYKMVTTSGLTHVWPLIVYND